MTMGMRKAAVLLCGVAMSMAISMTAALAQDSKTQQTPPNPLSPVSGILSAVTNAPDGWTPNLDGSYRNAAANIACPKTFKDFTLNNVTGPAADSPNVLGACRYNDGEGRTGSIRIRKYQEGWGSDLSLASNDRRTGASRLTVTTVRNGYLVDCSVAQIEHSMPKGDFPLYCTTIPTAAPAAAATP